MIPAHICSVFAFSCNTHTHTQNQLYTVLLQEKLLRAAKARIHRMCQEKTKRKDLQAPKWLVDEWANGNKTSIARVLQEENFDRVIRLHLLFMFLC